jgi:phospholipid-binding lipoprotein MlaA
VSREGGSPAGSGWRGNLWLLALVAAFLFTGCASAPRSDVSDTDMMVNPADPWERWNRRVFDFNDSLDAAVLKPVAQGYNAVTPSFFRQGVTNFFGNFRDVWSGTNKLLQGDLSGAGRDAARVGLNTVFGLFGVIDLAAEAGIEKRSADFGQTLARWGVKSGPYVVLPVLGPSTLRDSLAVPLNLAVSPSSLAATRRDMALWTGLDLVNTRANLLWATGLLGDVALDKYSFIRDGYLQRRRSETGEPEPPQDEERYDLPEPTPPPSAPKP